MPLIPAKAKPRVDPANSGSAWLVGALSTLGVLLSAVGIGTGDVPRVLRNEPVLASTTFVLVLAASLLAVSAGWLTNDAAKERRLIHLSAFALFVAAVAALFTGIASAKERPEPTVAAQIVIDQQDRGTLHFGVKDIGLRSKDKIRIEVRAVDTSTKPSTKTTVYAASLGPDSSGAVDHTGEVGLPPAPANDVELQAWVGTHHECSMQEGAATGCVKLHINRLFEKPQLAVAWRSLADRAAGLTVSLSAHDIAGHRVVLRILSAPDDRRLFAATWPSSGAGSVDESVTAVVPARTTHVCVAASTTEDSPSCSAPAGSGDATVLMAVPPS
jgi:hypothetical protein